MQMLSIFVVFTVKKLYLLGFYVSFVIFMSIVLIQYVKMKKITVQSHM